MYGNVGKHISVTINTVPMFQYLKKIYSDHKYRTE